MLGSMGGFFITLIKGADSLSQGDTVWGVIFLGLSLLAILFGCFAFRVASIYGKAEDDQKHARHIKEMELLQKRIDNCF